MESVAQLTIGVKLFSISVWSDSNETANIHPTVPTTVCQYMCHVILFSLTGGSEIEVNLMPLALFGKRVKKYDTKILSTVAIIPNQYYYTYYTQMNMPA
jgi:hypothetical protein